MSMPANTASTSICSYFIRNSCTRGTSCHFSHQPDGLDLSLTETSSSSAVCSHFLRGDCRFGDRCRQSHSTTDTGGEAEGCLAEDADNVGESSANDDPWDVPTDENGWPVSPSNQSTTIPKLGKSFKDKECKYFAQGNCRRGSTCTFQHVLQTDPSIPTTNAWGPHEIESRGNQQFRPKTSTISANHAFSDPCQFFSRGKCPRGDTCPFLHGNSELEVPITKDESLSQLCQFYLDGKCVRGDTCPFPHRAVGEETQMEISLSSDICQLNEAGKCTRGVACPFLHLPAETKSLVQANREVAEPCQFFGQGKCVRGDRCPFPHIIVASSPANNASSEPCTYFRLGRCFSGHLCRFKHSSEASSEVPVTPPLDYGTSLTEDWTHGQDDAANCNSYSEITTVREPCKYFNWGNCLRGTACKFLHASVDGQVVGSNPDDTPLPNIPSLTVTCKYFLLGVCRNGPSCSYSHASARSQETEQAVNASDGNVPATSRFADAAAFDGNDEIQNAASGTQEYSAARENATASNRPCKFFAQGTCKHGEACYFEHSPAYESPYVDPWPSENNGSANRDQATRVCKFFARGNCKKGTACNLLHDSANDQPYQSTGWMTSDETIQPGSNICQFFQQGNCKEGEACLYQHEKPLDPCSAWGVEEKAGDPWSSWGVEEPSNDWFDSPDDPVKSNGSNSSVAPVDQLTGVEPSNEIDGSITPVDERAGTEIKDCLTPVDERAGTEIKYSDGCLTPPDENAAGGLTTNHSDESDRIIAPVDSQAEHSDGSERSTALLDSYDEPEFTVERPIFHAAVVFSQGAAVRKVVTAFESQLLVLSNLPSEITENDITDLTTPFGEIAGVILEMSSPPGALIEFIECADAALAARDLDNKEYRSMALTARLELHDGLRSVMTASMLSRTAKISWSAPSLTGWAHYPTISQAKEQAKSLQGKLFCGRKVSTSFISPRKRQIHAFTVEIKGLPLDTTRDDIQGFCQGTSSASIADHTNYDRNSSILDVRSFIIPYEPIESFHVLPADASKTKIIAFANFASAESAVAIVKELHRTRQEVLKNNTLWVEQVYLAKYHIPRSQFISMKPNLDHLRETHDKECKIRYCERDENGELTNPVLLQIDGPDPKTVARAKKAVEEMLRGEPLLLEGNETWDDYFDTPDGAIYFTNLNTDTKFFVKCDRRVRTNRYFSQEVPLEETRDLITRQLRLVRGRRHVIHIDRNVIRPLLTSGLKKLKADNGITVTLNAVAQTVTVQGNRDDVIKRVKRFLAELSTSSLGSISQDCTDSDQQCSICASAVVDPVDLPCRHVYCKICLQHILRSSAGPHFSPLRCMADQQNDHTGMRLPCYADVPYNVIRDLLSEEEETKLLEFSLLSYLRAHQDKFRFCPTADCLVVYRPGIPGIVFRCPSCQKRICPSCCVEYHEGLSCVDYQDA